MSWIRVTTSTLLFFLCGVAAAFDIPKGLSESDRREIILTLGLNSATKMLDNPYPLGGFSGFEIGLSQQSGCNDDLQVQPHEHLSLAKYLTAEV